MNPLDWAMLIGMVLAFLTSVTALYRNRAHFWPVGDAEASDSGTRGETNAFAAGILDVTDGWIAWATADAQTYDEWERLVESLRIHPKDASGYLAPSPMLEPHETVHHLRTQQPRTDWGLDALRGYMRDIRTAQEQHRKAHGFAPSCTERLTQAAALITDLREDTYDPATAQITATWAYHESTAVRAAYIEGRAKGTENIMEIITATRIRAREIDAAGEAVAAANERHKAALAALRETNRDTAARDAHAAYEAEMRALTDQSHPPEEGTP